MKHNIYLLKPKDKNFRKWDCYLGHIVIADSIGEARKMCISDVEGRDFWLNRDYSTIKLIGKSNLKKGLYLSSFNSG